MPQRRSPLREQSFRLITIGGGLVIGIAVAVFLPVVFGRDHRIPVGLLLIPALFVLVVLAAAIPIGLAIGRRIVGDRIEVAMRSPNQSWQHGRLTVSPAHLSFQPYALQLRIPSGPPIEFEVSELGDDVGKRPGLRQIWKLNPQLHIVTMTTDHGVREIAALPSRFPELRERLMLSGSKTSDE